MGGSGMAIAAQLYQDGREAERYRVGFDATLRDSAFVPLDVVVEDLSIGGFRVVTTTDLSPGAEVGLGLAGIGTHRARVVWRGEGIYGCEFVTSLKEEDLRTALSAPPSDPIALPIPAQSKAASPIAVTDQESEHSGLNLRGRFFAIIAAAITAWVLVAGLGWIAFRVILALLPR